MKRTAFAALAAGLIGMAGTAWAHHSFAASYDTTQPMITVHGVITQVLLRNPHSWFMVNIKDESSGKV